MSDNLFGVKANFGFRRYNDGKDIDYDFTTNQYCLEVQGVINLGCNLLTNTSQEMSFSGNRKSNTDE